jgi:hypothetical protein
MNDNLDYKELLLQFLASLTMCEDIMEVSQDVYFLLNKMEIDVEWEILPDLASYFAEQNITTLYGSSLKD